MKSKINKVKLFVVLFSILAVIAVVIFLVYIIFGENKNPYGNRCDEAVNNTIDNKQMKKIKNKFKEFEEVNRVEVYTKLCTVKIIVNLKNDIDLSLIKEKAKEIFQFFSEDELSIYDFALYVTSDNKDSEIYPINVSKHNSREDFAW